MRFINRISCFICSFAVAMSVLVGIAYAKELQEEKSIAVEAFFSSRARPALFETVSSKLVKFPEGFDSNSGKIININGDYAFIVKGNFYTLTMKNIQGMTEYAISRDNFIGYTDWKPLTIDSSGKGSFTETISVKSPGLYKTQIKFRNSSGQESKTINRNFFVDWSSPAGTFESHIKGQTATKNSTITMDITASDDASPYILYNFGEGWKLLSEGYAEVKQGVNKLTLQISDINGNITELNKIVFGM
ncbi:MAG: hypothetical protein XD50_1362 [Clostridia bacterium 41_269]|nr:MAG: hypothetical protein XD50_1362 [Clostridia bacterium 41_269]